MDINLGHAEYIHQPERCRQRQQRQIKAGKD
ncbi:hypothetical protein LTSEWAN_4089, partial [Salmonella enterica subsp. enterica serovar Wandsworth str. A4-580]